MLTGGGGASNAVLMGGSFVTGVALSPVSAWLGNLSQGEGALLGTVIVGVVSVLAREACSMLRWYLDNGGKRGRKNDTDSPGHD